VHLRAQRAQAVADEAPAGRVVVRQQYVREGKVRRRAAPRSGGGHDEVRVVQLSLAK
jgi:hypothetical protein